MKTPTLLAAAALAALAVACGPHKEAASEAAPQFVTVKDGNFYIGDSLYNFIGTNFWYGAILGSDGQGGDRARLVAELDSLHALGLDNLRILAGGDGDRPIKSHIEPTLQLQPGVYNDTILRGLDFLLAEMEKRDMKGVIYLNNSWEWSGGYGQYLEWAGEGVCPLPEDGYEQYCDFAAKFPLNEKAREMALNHVRTITSRTNSITGKPYAESPAIMSWQICNEPRPFSTEGKEAFAQWLIESAKTIKENDPNHLVSTGSEGKYGCHVDLDLWREIHADPNIDYANIHVWPYNWGWVTKTTLTDSLESAKRHTAEYIDEHIAAFKGVNKPIVLEEFGFPRDNMAIAPGSPTTARDSYYDFVMNYVGSGEGQIAGINFWGWGGMAQPTHRTWERWDQYSGDPAQEDQGLNSVFRADSTTVEVIKKHTGKL